MTKKYLPTKLYLFSIFCHFFSAARIKTLCETGTANQVIYVLLYTFIHLHYKKHVKKHWNFEIDQYRKSAKNFTKYLLSTYYYYYCLDNTIVHPQKKTAHHFCPWAKKNWPINNFARLYMPSLQNMMICNLHRRIIDERLIDVFETLALD